MLQSYAVDGYTVRPIMMMRMMIVDDDDEAARKMLWSYVVDG